MKKAELRKIIDENLIPLLPKSKKAVLWELPYYTNLGDTLIWQGEESFLAVNNINIINRMSFHSDNGITNVKLDKDVTIFLQGGGNFGDVWIEPMEFRRKVISKFTDNQIILFPQTVFYQDQELAKRDAGLFAQHKNLTLCARDQFSFDFLSKYFSANTILMMPDMAFCIDDTLLTTDIKKTSKNLFASRIDNELNPSIDYKKYLPVKYETADWPSFKHPPNEFGEMLRMINEGDQSVDDYAVENFMPKMTQMGVDFLSSYDAIFSTRLHVAILSFLLGKEITWFDNSYGKNSDFYDTWLKGEKGIQFIYGDLLNRSETLTLDEKIAIKTSLQQAANMKKTPLISVIIPVYNVEKYLDQCIESVICQTYKNIEILLVDDKTPDNSGKMADEWARKDDRIVVIHKPKNEGLNLARKTGFDASKGKYVTFLDSDDYLDVTAIEQSFRYLQEHEADVAAFPAKEVDDVEAKRASSIDMSDGEIAVLDSKDTVAWYALFGEGSLPGIQHMTAWGKLYTRGLLDEIDWDAANYRLYEDNFWTPQILLKAKKVVLISKPLMFYRRNVAYGATGDNLGNRMTGNSFNGNSVGYVEYVEQLQEYYKKLARLHGFKASLDQRINEYAFLSKTWRIDNLAKADMLDTENNLEHTRKVLQSYIVAKNRHIDNLAADIHSLNKGLRESNEELARIAGELNRLAETHKQYLGIKRSVRLLAGNIKRRIIKPKN